MPTLNEQQLRAIGSGMRAGRWADDPKKMEKVRSMLKQHRTELFAENKLDTTPDLEFVEERRALGPKGFASKEAEEDFLQGSEGQYRRMAQQGIDVNTGLDEGIRARAGLLNFRPEVAGHVMEELVNMSNDYSDVPPEVPRFAQVEGNPVYLRKTDNGYKYTATDPIGVDSGDFAEFSAELPSIAMETLGGVGGAIGGGAVGNVPGAIAGSAAGSAALAALGVDARVKIAKWAGVPEELIDDAVRDEDRLYAALWAAGGDLATAGLIGTIRAGRNQMGGRIMTDEQVDALLPEVEKSLGQVAEFQAKTGQDLDLSMGQLTGDTDIIAAEGILRQRAKGKVAKGLGVRQINTDRAANDALRGMTDVEKARSPVESARGTAEVAEDVQRGLRGEADQARRLEELAEEELDTFSKSMDEAVSPDTMVRVRDDAHAAAQDAATAERKAWDNYRKEVSWKQGEGSNVQIVSSGNNSPIAKALLEMDDDAGRALMESSQRSQRAFVKDAGLPDSGPTQGLAAEFLDPRELHFTLSDLKRRVRQAERGNDPDGFRVTDMRKMIGAIEETIQNQPMRYRRAGRLVPAEKAARVREAWDLANETTVKTHSLFDNANMKTLLEINPRTKELTMPSGMIYKRLFKEGDPRFLDDAMEASGHNPAIKAALGEELLKKHKNATKTDFSGDAHRRFMDDHYDHIRSLGLDPDTIRGAGGLARAVKEASEQAAKVEKRLAQTFGKRLTDDAADAVNVHDELMGVGKRKAQNVMGFLDRTTPPLANQVRRQSLDSVRRQLSSNGDTAINFNQLWKTLDQNSDQLAALHGRQYVDDLRMLKRTQELINREKLGKSIPGQGQQPAWLDITRSLFGPLSKKQRFLSAVQRTSRRLQARAAKNVLSDPNELRRFVQLRSQNPAEVARNLAVGDLGALADATGGNQIAADLAGEKEPVQNTAPAGNSIVPGRPSPAEAVGGKRPDPADATSRPSGVPILQSDEGFRGEVYDDSEGHRTIGFGRNLDANPVTQRELRDMEISREEFNENGINQEQAQVLFANDYVEATRQAIKTPGWDKMNGTRKDALINIYFNMGKGFRRKFPSAIKALAAGDYETAANELLTNAAGTGPSLWVEQTGPRAEDLAETIRTGVPQGSMTV